MKPKLVLVSTANRERRILPKIWGTLGLAVLVLNALYWLRHDQSPAPAAPDSVARTTSDPSSASGQTSQDRMAVPELFRPVAKVSATPMDTP